MNRQWCLKSAWPRVVVAAACACPLAACGPSDEAAWPITIQVSQSTGGGAGFIPGAGGATTQGGGGSFPFGGSGGLGGLGGIGGRGGQAGAVVDSGGDAIVVDGAAEAGVEGGEAGVDGGEAGVEGGEAGVDGAEAGVDGAEAAADVTADATADRAD